MIQLSSAGKHYGSKTLFEDLSWVIADGDRVGLVGRTVLDECLSVFGDLLDIEKEMEALTHKMAELDAYGAEYQKVADRYHKIETKFQQHDGYGLEAQVGTVLSGLGFSREDMSRPT